MDHNEELKIIRARWSEGNRYSMIEQPPYALFEKSQTDITYLLGRLEAAERTAKLALLGTGKFVSKTDSSVRCPHCKNVNILAREEAISGKTTTCLNPKCGRAFIIE